MGQEKQNPIRKSSSELSEDGSLTGTVETINGEKLATIRSENMFIANVFAAKASVSRLLLTYFKINYTVNYYYCKTRYYQLVKGGQEVRHEKGALNRITDKEVQIKHF